MKFQFNKRSENFRLVHVQSESTASRRSDRTATPSGTDDAGEQSGDALYVVSVILACRSAAKYSGATTAGPCRSDVWRTVEIDHCRQRLDRREQRSRRELPHPVPVPADYRRISPDRSGCGPQRRRSGGTFSGWCSATPTTCPPPAAGRDDGRSAPPGLVASSWTYGSRTSRGCYACAPTWGSAEHQSELHAVYMSLLHLVSSDPSMNPWAASMRPTSVRAKTATTVTCAAGVVELNVVHDLQLSGSIPSGHGRARVQLLLGNHLDPAACPDHHIFLPPGPAYSLPSNAPFRARPVRASAVCRGCPVWASGSENCRPASAIASGHSELPGGSHLGPATSPWRLVARDPDACAISIVPLACWRRASLAGDIIGSERPQPMPDSVKSTLANWGRAGAPDRARRPLGAIGVLAFRGE